MGATTARAVSMIQVAAAGFCTRKKEKKRGKEREVDVFKRGQSGLMYGRAVEAVLAAWVTTSPRRRNQRTPDRVRGTDNGCR